MNWMTWTLNVCLKYRLIFISVFVSSVALGIAYLHFSTYKYTAELRVTAVYSSQQLPSGIGGIASLAGISLPGDKQVTPIALYSEALRSRDIADAVVADKRLMQHIFARNWDAEASEWRQNAGPFDAVVNGAKRLLGVPVQAWHAPDSADVQRHLQKNMAIIESQKTNVTTIAVNDPDPEMAKRLLSVLNSAADNYLRKRELRRSTEYVAYLERKLTEVEIAEYRQSLVQALSSQERMRMMASSSVPFAAEPMGRIIASVRPTTPKPVFVILASVVLGLLLAVLACLSAQLVRNVRNDAAHAV
jgi:uncharacterized protein involved in exopolysaccharide biosynthesis